MIIKNVVTTNMIFFYLKINFFLTYFNVFGLQEEICEKSKQIYYFIKVSNLLI